MKQAECKSSRSGFTLIEMLVVIAIVGILAGLLMPALKRVMDKGRSAQCQSNMRQLLIALHLYEQDEGFLPVINGSGNTNGTLIKCLMNHVDNAKVFHCPSHQGRAGEESSAFLGNTTCYKYNDNGDITFFQGKPLDNPAIYSTSLVLLIDSLDYAPRHSGGANLGFADGHVEWLSKDKYDGADPNNPGNIFWYTWGKK